MCDAEGGSDRPLACVAAQVVKNSSTPAWKEFEVGFQQLCAANVQQPIRFSVFAWDRCELAGHYPVIPF
jgi:hypothetical protein